MYLSCKNKAAEILLAITHCNNCYSVFSLQFLSPWEMHRGNHMRTMTEVGRPLHRSPCPKTLFNQGHPRASCPVLCPNRIFWISAGWRPHNFQCQCLVTLRKEGHPVIIKAGAVTIKLCSCQASDSDTRPFICHEITHSTSAIIILQFQPIEKYIYMLIHSHFLKFPIFCSAFFYPRKTFPYYTFGTLHHFPHMLEDILGTSLILICRSSSSAAVKGAGEDCDIKYFLYPLSETSSWKHNINIYQGFFRLELFFKDFLWKIAKSSCLPYSYGHFIWIFQYSVMSCFRSPEYSNTPLCLVSEAQRYPDQYMWISSWDHNRFPPE